MIGFPGAVYAPTGRRVDRRGPDLTVQRLHKHAHSAVVSRPRPLTVMGEDLGVEVGRVWVLANCAAFEAVPRPTMDDTLDYIRGGAPVLLLSHYAEVLRGMRDRMLAALMINERTEFRFAA